MQLTAENTAIVLDSTADLPNPEERHANWRLVPLYVHFGTETFRDYLDLTALEFYGRLRSTSEPPCTSQPTPADFTAAFEELAAYERIYCVLISGKLSGTVESARLAVASSGRQVVVVDSTSASGGIVLLADAIQRRLERGTDRDELTALVERHKSEAGLLFTVDTLDYLVRGGRIGKAAGFAGGLLSVKPILSFAEGEVVPAKRVRGRARALAELERIFVESTGEEEGLHVAIAHADALGDARTVAAAVERARPQASVDLVSDLGPVVGTHAGPGTIGLFWFQDDA